MPFVELPTGARLHYEDSPPGQETIIAVHGMLGTPALHFARLREWLTGEGYRFVAPTLRGYGLSTPRPRDFPLDFYHRDAEDVLAFMDALDIRQAHIMGYSDGGEVALLCAGKQPGRFRSAVVWGAVGYFGPAMRAAAQRLYPADWITEEEQRLHAIHNPNVFILGWIRAIKHLVDAGGDVSLSLADKITCPALLMLGRQDTLNPELYGRRFIERTPNGRLAMFECGHAVHDEQWDAFRQIVGAFLTQS